MRSIQALPLLLAACLAWGLPANADVEMANVELANVELAQAASSNTAAPAPLDRAAFAAWLEGVKAEATQQGISRATADAALNGLVPLDSIVRNDRRQAEFTLTLDTYMQRIVTPDMIRRGKQAAADNRGLLEEVTRRYGVPGRYILAIWGMESRYGNNQGSTPVIQATATLAFEGRRAAFYRGELMNALRILDQRLIEPERLKGSWAGAMGSPQFMPSSYMTYAVDFDGDGRRDIWTNRGDTFASIANYLAKSGWADMGPWGRAVILDPPVRAQLPTFASNVETGCRAVRTLSAEKTFDQWRAVGVRDGNGASLPVSSYPAALILPDGENGPGFFAFRNYRAILRYNCSHLYAITVGTLAEAIGGS